MIAGCGLDSRTQTAAAGPFSKAVHLEMEGPIIGYGCFDACGYSLHSEGLERDYLDLALDDSWHYVLAAFQPCCWQPSLPGLSSVVDHK